MKNISNILTVTVTTAALAMICNAFGSNLVKGGERLIQSNGIAFAPSLTASACKQMSCHSCKDVAAAVPAFPLKGLAAPTKTVVMHGCQGCGTSAKILQAGKHSPANVYAHTCTICGMDNPAGCNEAVSVK